MSSFKLSDNGIVLLDDDKPEEAVELMDKLASSKKTYDEAREAAFSFMKKHFDVKPVYTKLLEELK